MPFNDREITCSSMKVAIDRLRAEGWQKIRDRWYLGGDRSADVIKLPSGRVRIVIMGLQNDHAVS